MNLLLPAGGPLSPEALEDMLKVLFPVLVQVRGFSCPSSFPSLCCENSLLNALPLALPFRHEVQQPARAKGRSQ